MIAVIFHIAMLRIPICFALPQQGRVLRVSPPIRITSISVEPLSRRTLCASYSPLPSSRRQFLQHAGSIAIALPIVTSNAAVESQMKMDQVFFDITVNGREKGRITIALYSDQAPATARTFVQLAKGTLRNRTGRTAGYRYSQASRVIRNNRVYLGRLNQIDAVNQTPGTPQRQQKIVEFPHNNDQNDLSHNQRGLVTVQKGGSFEFAILAKPDVDLDASNTVIGYVVDGMDVVDFLVNIPTNRKTIRDGYRNIGKFIGDPRAKVQVTWPILSHVASSILLFPHAI